MNIRNAKSVAMTFALVVIITSLILSQSAPRPVSAPIVDSPSPQAQIIESSSYIPISEPAMLETPPQPVPQQVVIQFSPQATELERKEYINTIGGTIVESIDSLNTYVVTVTEDVASQPLPYSDVVSGSERDYYVSALDDAAPVNDPRYGEQWALPAIGAPWVWTELPTDTPKVTLAVIDSGICASHPDLAGRILAGWDFLEDDTVPQDDFGHGCSVSGIIAANIDDGIGIAGIAPNVQIMPLRVLDVSGVGSYSDVAAAIVYAVDHDAQIINLSLGGATPSATLESAVNYAISRNVTLVAAAGNSAIEAVLYPAAYSGVIAVGSVDPNLEHSTFSNYGPQVDIWAPGRDILTTKSDGNYELVSGTSFATPYVAGAEAVEMARGGEVMLNSGVLLLNDTLALMTETETGELSTETALPAVTVTQASETATPTLTNVPTIAPTEAILTTLDPSQAGTGSIYRAQILLKQPIDLARVRSWNIKVLGQGGGIAIVQATPLQISKLARLGFEPTQIDSVEYMLAVQSVTTGETISQSDVTSSVTEMMALASVDTDSDGLTDTEEAWWCTNPNDENSDSPQPSSGTNPNDGTEVDNILRGIIAYGPPFALWPSFIPHNPNGTCPDGDFDGAPDYAEEFMIGTSNLRESSDKDKFDDGQELFGVTYCPASSGPCGYGILPRAEDAAFVSANLPAWVKSPGNSPFVAAFPEPQVEVVPSSLNLTRVTTITTTQGTMQGTEKTYGTSTTQGTSTSVTDTTTWNTFEEISTTKPLNPISGQNISVLGLEKNLSNIFKLSKTSVVRRASDVASTVGPLFEAAQIVGKGVAYTANWLTYEGALLYYGQPLDLDFSRDDYDPNGLQEEYCNYKYGASCDLANTYHLPELISNADIHSTDESNQNLVGGIPSNSFVQDNSGRPSLRYSVPLTYPINISTQTKTSGHEWGGSHSTSSSEYEEQTISESSTNQFSENWSTATAVDSSHAADFRFTYNIVNNGTEYAREVTSLTFNIYIGNNPNPAYTYVAVGSTGQIAKIENLFPGDELTYTSTPIALTLDEMRAIDEGASVRVVMEDISFGQDQVFYLDALSGSLTVAMEDGFDDSDELVDTYVVPVWDPSDSVQDVIKRYFPVTEDIDGNLLSVYTPESSSAIPTLCEQDSHIAPASYTTVYCKHALTGTSWWNIYLSDGLNYGGVFSDTLAQPNTTVLVRIVSDRDLDGYNDRNEIRIGTDPDDAASHPSPNLIAGYTTSCTGNDCTVRMVFQNLGNYDAYGVESVMYSPDGLATITNNTVGGSGRVPAGARIIVGPSDTFQYTKSAGSAEPVIVISYNDPQGNHRFILPSGNYPAGAQIATLDDAITALNGFMLADPGVDISSTSSNQAGFVINSPHPTTLTNGKLFVEYIDGNGNVLHEDVTAQNFASGPTVVSQTIDLETYPPETTILLAFLTDSAGNIIDSSARPLASFGVDPAPEANVTVDNWEIGPQSVINVPNPWNLGAFEPGTTLHARIYLTNTGLGDLRYSLTGLGNGWSIAGNSAGTLGPTQQNVFDLSFDSAGMTAQTINHSLYLRTNDPANGTVTINLLATIATPAGTATAYQVSSYKPWDQFVYVPGPHNQNDIVNFTHALADDPSRMFPLYLYNEDGTTLKGVGEYGVDFSGQTAPFGVFGTGADGDLTVTNGQTIYTDNTRSAVSTTANSAQSNITLSSASGFAAGQEVLIIQVQGTGAGLYEFANIASVASNTLTLTKNLTNTFTVGGSSKAQVIRVMQYHDVTVQSGGVLTAHAWDGSSGGIVAFRSSGNTIIDGQINVSSLGYRGGKGGIYSPNYPGGGYGESYGSTFEGSRNSGDTNSSPNGGGGGGGKGQYGGGTAGGGGGGSYGSNGTSAPNSGGQPGGLFGLADLSNIYLGSGGGGGGKAPQNSPNTPGGDGGAGGGIVMVYSRAFNSTNGFVRTNGANGGNCGNGADESGGGGGGAGGAILIKSQNAILGASKLIAIGGNAGNGCKAFENGGAGGNGRIRVEYETVTGTTTPSASVQQVNYYSITGQGAPFGVFGNGSDGDLTVASGQTIYTDNIRSALASAANSGLVNITVSNATGFATGKEVLIIQVQGTGAGAYEFAAITNVSGNTLTLSKPLGSTYTTGGNSTAQVLVVPQYHDVTVQSGGILTAHAWDGSTGGVIGFRASGTITVNGTITANGVNGSVANVSSGAGGAVGIGFRGGNAVTRTGSVPTNEYGYQGESSFGFGTRSSSANGMGGGGGWTGAVPNGSAAGGGGGHSTSGTTGQGAGQGSGGAGGGIQGSADLTTMLLGAGGGGAIVDNYGNAGGGGGGGGIIFITGTTITINASTGLITSNGGAGGNGDYSSGGGGSGGSILIKAKTATLNTTRVTATAGNGGALPPYGGNGGSGRIRIEYDILTGTTNPSASTQQVNYFNLTGSASNTLYLPDTITNGNYLRYQLMYGQRSVNTSSGDQLFTVHLANHQYSSVTLSALTERVVSSGSTLNFCLDFGNNGTCDYTANNQTFTGPVRLDSTNLASVLNAYIVAQASSAPVLTIPIRVNISTPADVFLFNLSTTPLGGVDLQNSALIIAPQNGNPANNISEGTLVDLSTSVVNNGTTTASNFTVAFYLGDPANGGTLIGSKFIASLAAGATSPQQVTTWNTSGLLGTKTIYVKVDSANSISEVNEENNIASASAVIKKKPDLTIFNFQTSNVRVGEAGSSSVVIRNDGEADVVGAVVRLYLGADTNGSVLGNVNANVPQGQSVTVQIPFTINAAGNKNLFVKVDPADAIIEANEQNNVAAGSVQVGWDLLTVDTGSMTDLSYSPGNGYGWLTQGTTVTTCGTQLQQSYRQAGSAESLQYKFDNLIPGRRYHLDLTFATCSGDRYLDLFVDGVQMAEAQTAGIISPVYVTSTPHTVSLLLDPDSYASDGSISLSISRNSGFGGPLVNIIDLQEVKYCYLDSGPNETPWSLNNDCGYDSSWSSDGFNGWGPLPYETMRFGTGSVKYKFSNLAAGDKYNLRTTYYEEDDVARIQRVTFDGAQPSSNFTLGSNPTNLIFPIPASSYADSQIVVAVERPAGGDAIVSEVVLEEDTRLENNRYSAPGGGGQTPTPTFTPIPTGTLQVPQVTIGVFSASWIGTQVKVDWSTTTEINNNKFELYRATNVSGPWVLASQIVSKHSCGIFTSTSQEAYTYTDAGVSTGTIYYYKLHFSGEGCGAGGIAYSLTAKAELPVNLTVSSIVRINPNPTARDTIDFRVVFSEPVTGVDTVAPFDDFSLTTTGVAGASITSVTPESAIAYKVTVNTGGGNGTIRLDVKTDGNIVDSESNLLTKPYTSGEIYAIAKTSSLLVTPANNGIVSSTTPTFTWKTVTGVLEYQLQVAETDWFTASEVDHSQPSGTTYTSSALDYGVHYWRMRVRTASGWGPWTPAWKFTLTPASPTAPILASPANTALLTDNTPDLAWNMAVEDDRYELQIDNLSTFASPEQTFSAGTGVLTYTATTLPDGIWYWRVRTINYLNVPSTWSTYRSFTVDTTGPVAPVLSAPANAASIIGTPAFSWAAAATATKYQFEYDNNADFSSPTYTSIDLTTTSHTPPAIALGTYSWHVRGKDAVGNWGAWSMARTVTILPAVPVAPVLVSPAASAVTNDPTPDFSWNSVVSGNTYQLEISNASTFATKQQTFVGGTGVLNYTATNIPDGVWYWHVRALNVNGVAGAWSAYRSFTVDTTGPVAPVLSAPANAASIIGTPAFSWTAAATATKYQFEYDNDVDFSSPTYTSIDLTTTSHTPPAMALSTYSWHVRGKDAAGNWGAWSTARTVTILPLVPVAPVLVNPAASAVMNDSTPDFAWNSVVSGNTYQLEVSNASTFATKQQTFAGSVGVLTYTATNIPDGVWYWHVRALNVNSVAGAWSAYRSFTVDTTGPVAPVLSAPANAASVIGTSAFTWAAAATATKYQFEYDNDADFSSPTYTSIDLTTTSHTPPAIALGTYSWHVRGKDAAGNWGTWSAARTVTILPLVPVAPTLATPAASAVINDSTPDFTWNSVVSGNTYELEISNASTFATKQQTFAGGVGVLNYTATTIPDGVWYWHVRALNVNGVAGAWSAYRSFTVDTTGPVAPVLSAPANAASVIGTPAFSWAAAATATKYQFEYDNDSDFSSPIYTSIDLTTTSHTPPAIALGTYSWHVRGKDAAGNWGAWSTARTFTILPAVPVAPVLVNPAASAVTSDSTPDFTWNNVVSGNTYQLEISNASTFATKQQTFAGGVGVLTYTATNIPDGVWYWHVRALNVNSVAGAWSAYRSFTVDTTGPVAPTLSAPANAASVIGTPAFSWAAAATATKYQFEYDNDTDFSSPIYTSIDLTTTSHTPPTIALGTYSWHVRGKDAAGNWGTWSTARTVTILPAVPVAPTLATPATSAVTSDSTPDFAWNSVVSGNTYQLEISNASTFATKQQTFTGGVGVLNYTAANIPDGVWYWHVRALNVNGVAGTWSAYRSFTVDTTGPVAPTLTAPVNAASVNGTPAFSWAAAATATKYQFEYDNDADFSSPIYTSADLTTTSHTPPAMVIGTYSWHVRGKDAAGNWGAWSAIRTVSIIPLVPASPTLTSPANGSISQSPAPALNWTTMPNAASYQVQMDNNSTFSSPEFDGNAVTNTITPSSLADGIYYWRVRQTDILGGTSLWSAAWRVTISQPIPAAPNGNSLRSLELPASDTGLPTFNWNSVEYGKTYQLQVADNESFTDPIFDDTAETTESKLTEPLAIGEYFWRVRAINEYGTAGPWTETWTITVDIPPAAPTLLLPSESTVSLNGEASFSWQDAENVEKYQIQVDDDEDFSSPEFDDTAIQTTRELPAALTDGTYFWRVRGLNIYDTAGEWSEVRSFIVSVPLTAPTLLTPEVDSTDETGLPAFEWESVLNGVTYQIQVDNNADFSSPEFDDTAETATRELATPLENGIYYWRVRAIKADDTLGEWSLVWNFTVNVP